MHLPWNRVLYRWPTHPPTLGLDARAVFRDVICYAHSGQTNFSKEAGHQTTTTIVVVLFIILLISSSELIVHLASNRHLNAFQTLLDRWYYGVQQSLWAGERLRNYNTASRKSLRLWLSLDFVNNRLSGRPAGSWFSYFRVSAMNWGNCMRCTCLLLPISWTMSTFVLAIWILVGNTTIAPFPADTYFLRVCSSAWGLY